MSHDGSSRKGCSPVLPRCSRRLGFSVCIVDTSQPVVPISKSLPNNKYAVLADDETETENVQVNLPTSMIKIIPHPKKILKFNPSVKKNDGPTPLVKITTPLTPQKEEMSSSS